MRHHIKPTRAALSGIVFAALAATACSSSSSSTGTASSTSTGSATSSDTVAASSQAAGNAAGVTAAKQAVAPYTGHPSPFPATEKLAKLPTAGSKFVFLQCGAPVCAIFAQLMPAPAKALGVQFAAVNSGNTATTSQAAAATALSEKPAAVLVGASDPQLYGDYLNKLVSAGSVVAGGGTVGGQPYGVQQAVGGAASVTHAGQLLADWVTVNKPSANVVFFGTPELTFSAGMQAAFSQQLTQGCPSCKADYQQLPIATFGTTAPSQVVSYLQSHPDVNTVMFASMEGATGLAAALKDAHLSPTTLGFAPTASNLQDIASGGLTAGLALDFNVQVWMQLNLAARELAHQATSSSNLEVDMQFLTKSDLQGVNVSQGWTGYPDVAQRFAALWGTAK
jgi:ribose transport system substrate-binding protein